MELLLLVAAAGMLLVRSVSFYVLRRRMPPGPVGWPVIGSMFDIPRIVSDPSELRKLVERYGPVVTLWNGGAPTILVASASAARELLLRQGSAFASRPASRSMELLTNGYKTINSAPYGPQWRAARRNLVTGVLHPSLLSRFASVQEEEVAHLVERLRAQGSRVSGVVAEVKRTLLLILGHICFGVRLQETELVRVEQLTREATSILRPSTSDLCPELKLLERILQRKNDKDASFTSFLSRQQELFGSLILSRKKKQARSEQGRCCYMDTVLEAAAAETHWEPDPVTLARELFIAGKDTTSSCVEWSMASLIANPRCQAKLFADIQANVPAGRAVSVQDIPKLLYLQAVVKETLRKHPPVYISAPHAPTRSNGGTLAGFYIPANASVLVHLQAIANNPEAWEQPDEFRPERFMESGAVDVTAGAAADFIPFGAGRRICPGSHLGLLHVHLIVANLIRSFEWLPPDGTWDMTPDAGFTVTMKNPLRAVIRNR